MNRILTCSVDLSMKSRFITSFEFEDDDLMLTSVYSIKLCCVSRHCNRLGEAILIATLDN